MIRRAGLVCVVAGLLLGGCAGMLAKPPEQPAVGAEAVPRPAAKIRTFLWDPAGRFFIEAPGPEARLEVVGDEWRYTDGGRVLRIALRPLRRPMRFEGYRESWKKTAPTLLAGDFPGAKVQALVEIEENRHQGLAVQFAGSGSAALVPAGRSLVKLVSPDPDPDFAALKRLLSNFYLIPDGLLLPEDAPAQAGSRWAQAYAEARVAAAAGKPPEALKVVSSIRGGSQAGPLLEYEYARELLQAGRPPSEVLPLMENVARARPQAVDIKYNLALLRGRSGDLSGAIRDCLEYLDRQPEDVEALNSLARAYAASGDRRQAMLMFEKAKAVATAYALTYYHLGKFWAEADPKEAAPQFRQFLELEPGSEHAPEVRAWLEGR